MLSLFVFFKWFILLVGEFVHSGTPLILAAYLVKNNQKSFVTKFVSVLVRKCPMSVEYFLILLFCQQHQQQQLNPQQWHILLTSMYHKKCVNQQQQNQQQQQQHCIICSHPCIVENGWLSISRCVCNCEPEKQKNYQNTFFPRGLYFCRTSDILGFPWMKLPGFSCSSSLLTWH